MVIAKPLTKRWAESVLEAFIPVREKRRKRIEEMRRMKANKKLIKKVVDFEYAKALFGGSEAIVQEMLVMLVNSLPEDLTILQTAYQQENWQQLKILLQKLKGSSSYCGTLRLKAACDELENCIRANLTQQIPGLYQSLLAEIKAVQKFVNDRLFD